MYESRPKLVFWLCTPIVPGSCAAASVRPAPACVIWARSRALRQSFSPSGPKSRAWLFARLTKLMPIAATSHANSGSARKL